MGELAIMDTSGDTKITWSRDNETEIDIARAAFNKARAEGFAAYSVTKDGARGEVIRAFDVNAERIILQPPMAGG